MLQKCIKTMEFRRGIGKNIPASQSTGRDDGAFCRDGRGEVSKAGFGGYLQLLPDDRIFLEVKNEAVVRIGNGDM
jgi:hypothetical protein